MPGGLFITLQIDPQALREVQDLLAGIPRSVPKALATAINKTLPRLRTLVAREVQEELNIPYGGILHTMSIRKASRENVTGSVYVRRIPMPLIMYHAKQTKDGVSVAVRRSEGRETIKGAFIATMPGGHEGVFKRRHGSTHRTLVRDGKRRSTELPIKQLYGPTVVGVVAGKPGMADKLQEQGNAILAQNVESQTQWLLEKGTAQ